MNTEDKYNWLLSKMKVVDVDLWENDAILILPDRFYFQFTKDAEFFDLDYCVEASIAAEKWSENNRRKLENK